MTTTTNAPATADVTPGQRFLSALIHRDFDSLEQLLTADVWLRALLPRHLEEHHGAGDTADAFRSWYGAANAIETLATDHQRLAGKERISYRFLLRPQWAPQTWHLIEQTAILSTTDDAIRKIDLTCSGFLPLDDHGLRDVRRDTSMATPTAA